MTHQTPTAALTEAAMAAGFAPSVHNTQPWRWRMRPDGLDLRAARERQLQVADPEGRLLIISCGAALHHAQVALAAEGREAIVDRMPDTADPDWLARISVGEHGEASAEAMRTFQTLGLRHTDRRPVSAVPPEEKAIDAVRQAGTRDGVNVHRLTEDQVAELGGAAARADQIEIMDPEQRAEIAYWVGGDRPDGTGVPMEVIPDAVTPGVVPGRDFVREGHLHTGEGSDRAAVYLMLFGNGDEPADWLRAGEALSAAWLEATEQGLSVMPFSSVVEVPSTRETMRSMLSFIGYPYLVLRIGNANADHEFPPLTPRLPAEQTIEGTE
jgi:hypothetical protein